MKFQKLASRLKISTPCRRAWNCNELTLSSKATDFKFCMHVFTWSFWATHSSILLWIFMQNFVLISNSSCKEIRNRTVPPIKMLHALHQLSFIIIHLSLHHDVPSLLETEFQEFYVFQRLTWMLRNILAKLSGETIPPVCMGERNS